MKVGDRVVRVHNGKILRYIDNQEPITGEIVPGAPPGRFRVWLDTDREEGEAPTGMDDYLPNELALENP